MSPVKTSTLTPYDTGEILEPRVHPGVTGQVDFENDESSTLITVSARPTSGNDGVTVTIDTHNDDPVTVVINEGAVLKGTVEPGSTDDAEPTDLAYAVFGRYVAALLGSHEEWSGGDMLEDIAEYASNLTDFPLIGGQGPDEYALWRDIAGQLGIEHDGEDVDENV